MKNFTKIFVLVNVLGNGKQPDTLSCTISWLLHELEVDDVKPYRVQYLNFHLCSCCSSKKNNVPGETTPCHILINCRPEAH